VVLVIDSDSPFLLERGNGVTDGVASEVTWWPSGAELVDTFVVEGDVHELVDTFVVEGDVHELVDTLVVEGEVALEVDDGVETWWSSGAELVDTFVAEGGDALEVDDGGELDRGGGVVNRRAGARVMAGARVVV
jgi:hypothetical protein